MAFRFKRRGGRRARQLLGPEKDAAARVLHDAREMYREAGRDFELRAFVDELFTRAPTPDVRALKDGGLDADSFYDEEIEPNWDELTRAQRSAKVEAFTRLANALEAADGDPGEMGPLVRTKLLVLAWAHDETYDEGYLGRVDAEPERFGDFELAR